MAGPAGARVHFSYSRIPREISGGGVGEAAQEQDRIGFTELKRSTKSVTGRRNPRKGAPARHREIVATQDRRQGRVLMVSSVLSLLKRVPTGYSV